MIKKICLSIVVLLVVYIGVGYFLPSKIESSASMEIKASVQKIYPEVSQVKNWPVWAIWFLTDKEMKTEFKAGKVSWQSAKYGNGSLTIVDKKLNKLVRYEIEFDDMEPGVADISFTPSISDKNSTMVSWIAVCESRNIFLKPVLYFVFRPMMNSDFNASLTNLKNLAEGK